MSDSDKPDIGAYVDAAAQLIGLPVDPQYRDAVIANMERTAQIAGLALAQDLPDDLTSGPVFAP